MTRSLLVGSSLLLVGALAADSLTLSVGDTPGDDASATVDPSFAGFGIEPSNLFSFTGDDTPNKLSLNLLQNLARYTGAPPHIRLGGNTQDYMIYDGDNNDWAVKDNKKAKGNGSIASDSMLVGPRYFEAINRFPKGTPVTWGLNLGYDGDDYLEQLTTMADQVLERCDNLNITSLEIGNEPDLYGQNGFREGSWSGKEYTAQWLDRATAIYDKVLKARDLPSAMFEPGVTAFTAGTSFEIEKLVDAGIDDGDTKFVSAWNQHNYYYFLDVDKYSMTLERMMQWGTTESRVSQYDSQLEQADETGHPFMLREMAVVGPLGLAGISDTFGAALWTLNFLLYAATRNIASVQFHMTANSNASAWQPTKMHGRDPFVRPLYYGMAAFDQVIGAGARIEQTNISDYDDVVRAYSVFRDGALASVAVINGRVANSSESDKGSIKVQAELPKSLAGEKLHLAYLTGDGADATKDIQWNGVSFEKSGDGTPTQEDNEDKTVTVGDDGSVTFDVRDSQAVVATVGAKINGTSEGGDQDKDSMAARWSWSGGLLGAVLLVTLVLV